MAGNYEFITKPFVIYCNKIMSKMMLTANSDIGRTKKAAPERGGLYFVISKVTVWALYMSTYQ
jgi:hypothetical protein